jgi:hypothetical protein
MALTRGEAALIVLGWHASSDMLDAYDVVTWQELQTRQQVTLERRNVFQTQGTSRIDEAL